MPNRNYLSGRAFEYKVKKYLEAKGYLVFRSAGSHSVADLIAFPKSTDIRGWDNPKQIPLLIQCKHHSLNRKALMRDGRSVGIFKIQFVVAVMVKRKLKFSAYVNNDDNPNLYLVDL
jgi:hypothetical protein